MTSWFCNLRWYIHSLSPGCRISLNWSSLIVILQCLIGFVIGLSNWWWRHPFDDGITLLRIMETKSDRLVLLHILVYVGCWVYGAFLQDISWSFERSGRCQSTSTIWYFVVLLGNTDSFPGDFSTSTQLPSFDSEYLLVRPLYLIHSPKAICGLPLYHTLFKVCIVFGRQAPCV